MTDQKGAPDADPDADGMPNLFEYLADTNPTKASQKSEVRGQRVEWQGGAHARQFLERNSELSLSTNRWVVIYTNNPPTPLQTNLFDLLGTNRTLFYRVRAVRE